MPEQKSGGEATADSAEAADGGTITATTTTPKTSSKTSKAEAPPAAAPPPTIAYYDQIRRELREMISRKKSIDRSLSSIEDQIYKFEGSYLLETRENGNIVKGFDGYLKGQYARGTGRRNDLNMDADRIFTQSSGTYMKLLDQRDRENDSEGDDRSGGQKKKKKRKADDSDSSEDAGAASAGPKRVRISFKSNDE